MLLVKYIAQSGMLSRRKSEEAIKMGYVTINGSVVNDPTYVVQLTDFVKCHGKRVVHETPIYIVMNKPTGFITSKSDPSHRNTIVDLLPPKLGKILDPIGRLDFNTSGALLLSNDGDFVYKLSHPKFNVVKTYHVTASRDLDEEIVEKIRKGAQLEDAFVRPDVVLWNSKKASQITIELHSGKYRIIRRLLEIFSIFVKKLHRVSFAGITLKGVKPGEWRYLTEHEIAGLKQL